MNPNAQEIKNKAVVRDVKIEEIKIGDRLLQDITGYNNNTMMFTGQVISHREILFLRKLLARTKPTYAPEHYTIGAKATGQVVTRDGTVLVRAGQAITEELLQPLLKEGFKLVPTYDGGQMFFREGKWPEGEPWHVNDFNPLVRVETMTYVDEDGKELADPRGDKVIVGGAKKLVKA